MPRVILVTEKIFAERKKKLSPSLGFALGVKMNHFSFFLSL